VWKAFGLQPHRHEHFQFSTDPEFVDKVRDVVGLYMSPPSNAVVLCLDEKSQVPLRRAQGPEPVEGLALERTQPTCRCVQALPNDPHVSISGTGPLHSLRP
jgi:hypothetical protein